MGVFRRVCKRDTTTNLVKMGEMRAIRKRREMEDNVRIGEACLILDQEARAAHDL